MINEDDLYDSGAVSETLRVAIFKFVKRLWEPHYKIRGKVLTSGVIKLYKELPKLYQFTKSVYVYSLSRSGEFSLVTAEMGNANYLTTLNVWDLLDESFMCLIVVSLDQEEIVTEVYKTPGFMEVFKYDQARWKAWVSLSDTSTSSAAKLHKGDQ